MMRKPARIMAGLGLILFGATACASTVKTYEHPGAIPDSAGGGPTLGRDWEGVSYFLPRRRMQLNISAKFVRSGKTCLPTYDLNLELLPVEPDPRHVYQAKLRHRWSRDDEIAITTNELGLLSTTKLTTTDRTADIMVEIAGAAGAVLTMFPSSRGVAMEMEEGCPKPFATRQIFDPVSPKELDAINALLGKLKLGLRICVDGRWKTDGQFCSPTVTDLGPCAGPGCRVQRGEHVGSSSEGPSRPETAGRVKPFAKLADGLLYRRTLPHVIEIQEQHGHMPGGWATRDVLLVMLPNAGPISVVPFRAGPFVKTIYDVTFKDGVLTKWDANRPSELLEVARLPIRILKAFISVPADIFQLRINLMQRQTSLVNEQRKQIEAMQKLIELQRQIAEKAQKAQEQGTKPADP